MLLLKIRPLLHQLPHLLCVALCHWHRNSQILCKSHHYPNLVCPHIWARQYDAAARVFKELANDVLAKDALLLLQQLPYAQ